jgi:hypothetical protein
MHALPVRLLGLIAFLCLSLAGCASSKLVNEWSNPEYRSVHFSNVLVIGVSTQASVRRRFEDELVAKLKAAGVDAAPSYRYIAEDGKVDEARISEAVKQAQANAVIITRLVRVDKKTEVIPGVYQPAPAITVGLYPGYSAAWLGYYEPPRIREYDVFISETSLYDVARNQLVWTGTVQTANPGNIDKEIRRYVDLVIKAMKDKKIL